MARAAVPGRLSPGPRPWLVATVKRTTDETATARTLVLDAPGWPGHLAGQHVAVRLTAQDGYTAQRDYSIASAAQSGTAQYSAAGSGDSETASLEITVQRLEDGEVSSYLAETARPGDQFEVRGPIGGWFAWRPDDPRPLLLLAGGSGIVPLMSMIRTHAQVKSRVPVRLIYSARTPADVIYADEFTERVRVSPLSVTYLYTRARPEAVPPVPGVLRDAGGGGGAGGAPSGSRAYAGRLNAAVLAADAFPPEWNPLVFVCGPSGFVEAASSLLVAAGYPPFTIKTERFGPT